MSVDSGQQKWNVPLIQAIFPESELNRVASTPVAPEPMDDIPACLPKADGKYSVKRDHQFGKFLSSLQFDKPELLSRKELKTLYSALWSTKLHPRILVWAWKALCDKLPTKLNLFKRGICPDSLC